MYRFHFYSKAFTHVKTLYKNFTTEEGRLEGHIFKGNKKDQYSGKFSLRAIFAMFTVKHKINMKPVKYTKAWHYAEPQKICST